LLVSFGLLAFGMMLVFSLHFSGGTNPNTSPNKDSEPKGRSDFVYCANCAEERDLEPLGSPMFLCFSILLCASVSSSFVAESSAFIVHCSTVVAVRSACVTERSAVDVELSLRGRKLSRELSHGEGGIEEDKDVNRGGAVFAVQQLHEVGAQVESRLGLSTPEREERRCLLVARLKVCSVAERGAGGGRPSSRWLSRGMGGGDHLAVK